MEEGLKAFKEIYRTADENNLRNWKLKAISQLLQIYVQVKDLGEVKETLKTIQ